MFGKCPTCGATTLSLHSTGACSKCGAPLSTVPAETPAAAPSTSPSTVGLPQRKNASLEDRAKLEMQKMRHNFDVVGRVGLYGSWDEYLENRPHDSPFYTASGGVAVIMVLLTRNSISQPAVLDEFVRNRHPFLLHCKAFLPGGYPILRMNLCIPDNPADPLWLESALDLRDGDAQDFIEAVQAHEQIRVVLSHEATLPHIVKLMADAAGLAAVLREEVRKSLLMEMNGGESAFRAASQRMEQAFPSGADGLDRNCVVRIAVSEDVDFSAVARQIMEIMKPYFDRTGQLTDAGEKQLKEIGWNLHRGGGKDAMRLAFEKVENEARSGDRQSARLLSIVWDGVGDWRS